ncbi:MAG: o-succinylbenzoate synthase [Phocaeicola sp.]
MHYQVTIHPKELQFKQPAGTSRGVYTTRKVWYLQLTDTQTGRVGIGECAPLPVLSCDDLPNYEELLHTICSQVAATGVIDYAAWAAYPSIIFGLESALLHLQAGSWQLYNTPFSRGEAGIPINGLIWMGSFEEMKARIEEKLAAGYRCLKLKIGAIDFQKELELLQAIRSHFSPEQLEVRVDANGAFHPGESMERLQQLAACHLHSIEQPLAAGQWGEMARLCQETPLPIALDEELIGIHTTQEKMELLDTIRPQYIILKPSLHGGIRGSEEWIQLAAKRGIQSWVTSALESNVGLNAIAHWCASLHPTLPQGLGTGLLFTNNLPLPLHIQGDALWFCPQETVQQAAVQKWIEARNET